MKVQIKTIQQQQFEVEVPDAATVCHEPFPFLSNWLSASITL
jgi:hypothetical protein